MPRSLDTHDEGQRVEWRHIVDRITRSGRLGGDVDAVGMGACRLNGVVVGESTVAVVLGGALAGTTRVAEIGVEGPERMGMSTVR